MDITAAIARHTAQIIARRFTLENERHERNKRMALEIKGLKGKALKAGMVFDRLNRAYDKLIETGSAHADDVESLPPQFAEMQDDITFAVQTLGNSVNGSGEGAEKPKAEPVVIKVETEKTAVAAPAVAGEQAATFQRHAADIMAEHAAQGKL